MSDRRDRHRGRGLFGQPRDPLAGVFLVPLGWRWNRAVDTAPEPWWPGLAAAAPLLNLLLLGRAVPVRRPRADAGRPPDRLR